MRDIVGVSELHVCDSGGNSFRVDSRSVCGTSSGCDSSNDSGSVINAGQHRKNARVLFVEDSLGIERRPEDTFFGWDVCDCRASHVKFPLRCV